MFITHSGGVICHSKFKDVAIAILVDVLAKYFSTAEVGEENFSPYASYCSYMLWSPISDVLFNVMLTPSVHTPHGSFTPGEILLTAVS